MKNEYIVGGTTENKSIESIVKHIGYSQVIGKPILMANNKKDLETLKQLWFGEKLLIIKNK